MRQVLLYLLFSLISASSLVAQGVPDSLSGQEKRQVEITTMDWDVIRGVVVEQAAQAFVVRTYGGITVTIPFDEIREMKQINGPEEKRTKSMNGPSAQRWFPNKHGYRYLASGSYLTLPKGNGFVTNTYLTTNTFRYGISDAFSLGGGFESLSAILLNPVFSISPKLTTKLGDNWYAGGSISYVGVLNTWLFDGGGGIAVAQAGTTIGTLERSLSAGIGWTMIGSELAASPFATLSGQIRFSRRFSFVSDNILAPINGTRYIPFISYGLRYLGRSVSGELMFINTPLLIDFIGIGLPIISLSVPLD